MHTRRQRTIGRAAELEGIALFSAADVRLRLRPAPADHGLVFRRVDLPGAPTVPATIEFAVDRHRRTGISRGDAAVEMTEHVLAALAGLGIDNCTIEIDGPEAPGFDGSAEAIVDAIHEVGIVELDAERRVYEVTEPIRVTGEDGATGHGAEVTIEPCERFEIVYDLDYGPNAPFAPQTLSIAITPRTFARDLASARTFVLEAEVAALRERGYGARTTARDLVVYAPDGTVVDNELRWPDESVRHKVLDCVGDLALLGADLRGRVRAMRSGHQLNRDLVRALVRHEAARTGTARAA